MTDIPCSDSPVLTPPLPAEPAPEGTLHILLRQKSRTFMGLATGAGGIYALCFSNVYGRGLNVFLFSLIWIACLQFAYSLLGVRNLRRDAPLIAGILALAFSIGFTANERVQFVSGLGVLLLMFLLLAGGFADWRSWYWGQYIRGFFRLALSALGKLPEPLILLYRQGKDKESKGKYILMGLLISVPLCWAAVSVLASADWVFGHMVDRVFQRPRNLSVFWRDTMQACGSFLFGFLIFFCTLSAQSDKAVSPGAKAAKTAQPLIAVVFTGCLSAVYLLFCVVQVAYLFFGKDTALPNGYTYAEYAREGFFQLLFVSGCNMLLVLLCTRRFPMTRVLKGLLTVISGCTYIMILSSGWRMCLYVQMYGLTFLRILVLWFLPVLAIFMGAVTVYVYRRSFSLPRFFLWVGLVMWLLFAFARVDRIAARYNFERFGETSDKAASHAIYDLSMDAVPVMAEYHYSGVHSSEWEGYLGSSVSREYQNHGWRSFNISLWEAYKATEDYHDR